MHNSEIGSLGDSVGYKSDVWRRKYRHPRGDIGIVTDRVYVGLQMVIAGVYPHRLISIPRPIARVVVLYATRTANATEVDRQHL